MNKLTLIILSFLITLSFAQKVDTLEISYHQPVVILFPSNIKFELRGSDDINYNSVDNKVILGSSILPTPKYPFRNTTLHVGTEDGELYTFFLKYKEFPKIPTFIVKKSEVIQVRDTIKNTSIKPKINLDDIVKNCQKIESSPGSLDGYGIVSTAKKLYFHLSDMYVNDNKFYFKVEIQNKSNVGYDVDEIKFIIKSKKGKIRSVVNQDEVLDQDNKLIYEHNKEQKKVDGKNSDNNKLTRIFVFEKFTFSEKKELHIELWEDSGARIIEFTLNDKDILKMKTLQ